MDQTADTNHQTLWKLDKVFGVPDFVKQAEPLTSTEHLHYNVFADQSERRFPCNNRAQTWLSQLYFLENQSQVPAEKRASVQANVDRFAAIWNIEGLCSSLKDDFEKASHAPDLIDDDYALIVEHDGRTVKRFPVRNAKSAEAAARYLFDNRAAYPYEWRRTAAQNILRKAAQYGADLDASIGIYLDRAAGNGIAPAVKIAEALCSRATIMSPFPDAVRIRGELAKAASLVLSWEDPVLPHRLEKIAELIDAVDHQFGWHRLYTKGLATPEEVTHAFTLKIAEDINSSSVCLSNGAIFKLDDVKMAPKMAFAAALDDRIVSKLFDGDRLDMPKVASVLPGISRADASILEKALAGTGVYPIGMSQVSIDADSYV